MRCHQDLTPALGVFAILVWSQEPCRTAVHQLVYLGGMRGGWGKQNGVPPPASPPAFAVAGKMLRCLFPVAGVRQHSTRPKSVSGGQEDEWGK